MSFARTAGLMNVMWSEGQIVGALGPWMHHPIGPNLCSVPIDQAAYPSALLLAPTCVLCVQTGDSKLFDANQAG